MSVWRSTSTFLSAVFGVAATLCALLTLWSYTRGREVVSQTLDEETFERDEFDAPHLTFTLDRRTPIELRVDGFTLDSSWIEGRTLLVDDQNRVLGNYEFEIEVYSDVDRRVWSKIVVLPAGTYKVLVHGRDATRDKRWTDEHREKLQVSVHDGVVLARYGLVGLILFGIAAAVASSASEFEDVVDEFLGRDGHEED